MRLPRISVRTLMCVVVGAALFLHVIVATQRISWARTYHSHTWVHVQAGKPFISIASLQAPFWPRWWRGVLGLPSERLPLCPQVDGRLLDTCEYAHPEIRGRNRTNPTQPQLDLFRQLSNP